MRPKKKPAISLVEMLCYLVVGDNGVLKVGGKVAPLAKELPGSQVDQLDVHLQALDCLLVKAALLAVHGKGVQSFVAEIFSRLRFRF